MSGQDTLIAFQKTRRDLMDAVERWRNYGIALAGCERAYRNAYAKMILHLHEEKGVAWTACIDLAKGMDAVESLRFDRDVQKVQFEAEQERINVLKLEARFLDAELQEGLRGYGG